MTRKGKGTKEARAEKTRRKGKNRIKNKNVIGQQDLFVCVPKMLANFKSGCILGGIFRGKNVR